MEEKEIWLDVVGYEGYYQVSNMGRVKSLERKVWNKGRGCYVTISERILKAGKSNTGYMLVNLWKDGVRKNHWLHQLVCEAFCENPHGYKEVNHIDQNKENNCANNLEFCSRQYNMEYSHAKAVIGIDKITGLIVEYKSAKEAGKVLGINNSNIVKCCKGKYKSVGGFQWYYSNTTNKTE